MTVVARSDMHLCQPEFFFLPFDKHNESGISRHTRYFIHRDVEFIL